MSFPSLLSTISFAHLRPSASSSFGRSFSTSFILTGSLLGRLSPFPSSSSSPSTAPPPYNQPLPLSSRSYYSSPRPVFNLSFPPSLSRLSSSSPTPGYKPPRPPKHKPWDPPPRVVRKRSQSELERMEELQEKAWDLWKGMKFKELPKEEQKELRALEKKYKFAELALREADFNKQCKFEPMDGSSTTSLDLKRWFEDLPKKTLTQATVWDQFVTAEQKITYFLPSFTSSPRDRPLDGFTSLHFEDPVVDTKVGYIVRMMVTLFGTFALYLLAAILTDRACLKSEASGSTSWLLGPWGGWITVTALLSFACFLPHWIKNAHSRIAAKKRKLVSRLDVFLVGSNADAAMDVFQWRPLVRSHLGAWSCMFGHVDDGHLYSNLKYLVTGGFFAFHFFDDRSPFSDWFSPLFRGVTSWLNETLFGGWFEQHDDGWIVPRLRRIPGWLDENWALASNASTTSEPTPPLTGLYHFLVFCLTASAFSILFCYQTLHTFTLVPKAQRTLLRILKDPKELKKQDPPWFFDPKEKKIRMGPTIQSRIDCFNALGISQTIAAIESLAVATITFTCWNPFMIIPHYHLARGIFRDLKTTWEGESSAGPFGHFPGFLFGFLYFFVGATVWDWFLNKAKLIRRREQETAPPDPTTPSSSSAPQDRLLTLSSFSAHSILLYPASYTPHPAPEPVEEPSEPRTRWW